MPGPTDSASPQSQNGRSRGRQIACQFCFKRKMKCDHGRPCSNCVENSKECIPAERATRPRPTHDRIQTLEKDNESLRSFLNNLSDLPPDSLQQALDKWKEKRRLDDEDILSPSGLSGYPRSNYSAEGAAGGSRQHADSISSLSPHAARSRIQYGQSGYASAHGPTSAFFDEVDGIRAAEQPSARFDRQDLVSEEMLKNQATAKSAEERHLEILNLASGRLDFDGVAPDLAMHLLALHWNRQHFGFMVSYRPLFTRDMARQGPYFSKLLLNAMYFSVSKFSDRQEVYDDPSNQKTAGRRFLRRVKELLGEALDQSSITTVQAMLLLSSSLFALGQHSAAWLYSGIAIRMIVDMGLNYPVTQDMPAEEIEIRRRVVWSAFVYDKIISLYQGRAVSFDESQMHVPHRFLDWHEEQEQWTPYAFPGVQRYPGAAARAISIFTNFCSLAVIMGRVITDIYAEKDIPERPLDQLRVLSHSLDNWKANLNENIKYDPMDDMMAVPPPHVLSLHMVYWTTVTLLHRPFVETGHHHLTNEPNNRIGVSWTKCEEAAKGATNLLSRYRQTFSLARAPYLISYTTYVAATIHVRIAAQRGPTSEAGKLLSVCLDALRENGATNPGVEKMHSTILTLMERLKVNVSPDQTEAEQALYPSNGPFLTQDLDLEAIIKSFNMENMNVPNGFMFNDYSASAPPSGSLMDPLTGQDNLYGFLNYQ